MRSSPYFYVKKNVVLFFDTKFLRRFINSSYSQIIREMMTG
jgi:hypothetical protein